MQEATTIPAIQSWSAAEFVNKFAVKSATAVKKGPVAQLMGVLLNSGETIVLVVAKGCGITEGDKLSGRHTIVQGANADGEQRYYLTDKAGIFSQEDFAEITL